jgi:hypothetical protein
LREKHGTLVAAASTVESLVGGFGVKARCPKVPGFTSRVSNYFTERDAYEFLVRFDAAGKVIH